MSANTIDLLFSVIDLTSVITCTLLFFLFNQNLIYGQTRGKGSYN